MGVYLTEGGGWEESGFPWQTHAGFVFILESRSSSGALPAPLVWGALPLGNGGSGHPHPELL